MEVVHDFECFVEHLVGLREAVASGDVARVRSIVEASGKSILEEAYDEEENPRLIFKAVQEGHEALVRAMIGEWGGCRGLRRTEKCGLTLFLRSVFWTRSGECGSKGERREPMLRRRSGGSRGMHSDTGRARRGLPDGGELRPDSLLRRR